MKVKVKWKELGKQLWATVKPVLLAAIGISTGRRPQLLLALASCGIVSVAAGCSSLTPTSKVQSMGVYALGLPAVAIITQSSQTADYSRRGHQRRESGEPRHDHCADLGKVGRTKFGHLD